jgi:hypothetical protein
MQTAAGQEKLSKDSLMNLFNKPAQGTTTTTTTTTDTTTTHTTTTETSTSTSTPTTTTTAASSQLSVPSSPVKLSQRFNVTSLFEMNERAC